MGGRDVVSSVVSSQVDLHAAYGGVVPEIASRAHLELLNPVVAAAVVEAGVAESRIDAVGCTVGPGLIGALLVGVAGAKALAMTWGVPFVGVNHLEAHLYAAFLEEPELETPFVALLVSGGHTMLIEMVDHGVYRLLGQTIDDAAGEAFDKVARFLGLGYPGGPAIDRVAIHGDPDGHPLPAGDAARRAGLQLQRPQDRGGEPRPRPPGELDGERGRQLPAGRGRRPRPQGVEGGARRSARTAWCSAGAWPRTRCCGRNCSTRARGTGVRCLLPSPAMCTDNAAMIAATGVVPAAVRRSEPAGDGRGARTSTSRSRCDRTPRPAAAARSGRSRSIRRSCWRRWPG